MKTQNIAILSFHPDPTHSLEFDVKDVLRALGPHLQRWIWCIRNLDWLSENADAMCRTVEAAAPGGMWINSQELLNQTRSVYQTIEGEFLAFPRGIDPKTVPIQELSLRAFPVSRAELAIVAVDGGFIEVYAKEPDIVAALRAFHDVREENPENYF